MKAALSLLLVSFALRHAYPFVFLYWHLTLQMDNIRHIFVCRCFCSFLFITFFFGQPFRSFCHRCFPFAFSRLLFSSVCVCDRARRPFDFLTVGCCCFSARKLSNSFTFSICDAEFLFHSTVLSPICHIRMSSISILSRTHTIRSSHAQAMLNQRRGAVVLCSLLGIKRPFRYQT